MMITCPSISILNYSRFQIWIDQQFYFLTIVSDSNAHQYLYQVFLFGSYFRFTFTFTIILVQIFCSFVFLIFYMFYESRFYWFNLIFVSSTFPNSIPRVTQINSTFSCPCVVLLKTLCLCLISVIKFRVGIYILYISCPDVCVCVIERCMHQCVCVYLWVRR